MGKSCGPSSSETGSNPFSFICSDPLNSRCFCDSGLLLFDARQGSTLIDQLYGLIALVTTQPWAPHIYVNRAYPFLSATGDWWNCRGVPCIHTANHKPSDIARAGWLQFSFKTKYITARSIKRSPTIFLWEVSEQGGIASQCRLLVFISS